MITKSPGYPAPTQRTLFISYGLVACLFCVQRELSHVINLFIRSESDMGVNPQSANYERASFLGAS